MSNGLNGVVLNKSGILKWLEKNNVDGFTFLRYFCKDMKDPRYCNHNDIDGYCQDTLICLNCGILSEIND